jgi:transposase
MKTVWEAVAWVKEEYGIECSYEGMRGMLKRLRLHKKVPRPQHEKSDANAQTAWKKGGLLTD